MIERQTENRPYANLATTFVFGGIVWMAVALYIATNGEPIYGSLYTAPSLICFMLSYAVWSVKR